LRAHGSTETPFFLDPGVVLMVAHTKAIGWKCQEKRRILKGGKSWNIKKKACLFFKSQTGQ
jgi:hypothetical protein